MATDETRCTAFNPLAELGVSQQQLRNLLLTEFESQECIVLPSSTQSFNGCGVYAIYYFGDLPRYEPISNQRHNAILPIYVGKAVPTGTRTSAAKLSSSTESKLAKRLAEHRKSIEATDNLAISQFRCRYLTLSSTWIRFTESLLINTHAPWWNCYIDGFGLHDVGSRRAGSDKSVWDTLHPGRDWVEKRELEPIGSPTKVWNEYVKPSIEDAKSERTYKDLNNINVESPSTHAPSVEETSLFDFTQID